MFFQHKITDVVHFFWKKLAEETLWRDTLLRDSSCHFKSRPAPLKPGSNCKKKVSVSIDDWCAQGGYYTYPSMGPGAWYRPSMRIRRAFTTQVPCWGMCSTHPWCANTREIVNRNPYLFLQKMHHICDLVLEELVACSATFVLHQGPFQVKVDY